MLTGIIHSEKGEGIAGVNVRVKNAQIYTKTDSSGSYNLNIQSKLITVIYSSIGYKSISLELDLSEKQTYQQDIILIPELTTLKEVNIKGNRVNRPNGTLIDLTKSQSIPSVSGNFESILKTLPGVAVNNELSSQYSVRGGNFDENLVYINDIEIYRPLLIRNGQQEGLSFINSELTDQVQFSAGGFEARYGDKLSSALDVKYLRPDSLSVKVSAGLLGGAVTLKLPFKTAYLLAGVRLKSNQNILNTQDVKGRYHPNFSDYQILYHQDINSKLSFSLFGNYNLNNFTLIPQNRETKFGTFAEVLRLTVNYEGKEKDRYQSMMGAYTMVFKPSNTMNFKWINSVFKITEQENMDIEGRYIFDELETDLGNPDFGKVRASRGIGSGLDYARNKLQSAIYSTELRVSKQFYKSYFESGLRFQYDEISDKLNEFSVIDSAGYTLPNDDDELLLTDVINAKNFVKTSRLSGFAQNTFGISPLITLFAGLRGYYNSFTNETLFSPRVSLAYRPTLTKDLLLRFSMGSYNQQPFYRELRNFDGSLNFNAKSQRSIHFLSGADYIFEGLKTKLKFTSELYYKLLNRLTPYKLENLRIRYFADQESKGYATGADFSLSGKFAKDLESSFRLSFMKTAEDVKGDFYFTEDANGNSMKVEPGYLNRPSDQRINFSVFFQDRLLKSPTYKVHLNLLYGSALPVGPPKAERYQDVYKIPPYKRVDIGFSKDFIDPDNKRQSVFLKKYFKSLTAYVEIFNLFDINNTVSYLWVNDVNNNQYAVPNYLTLRQLNVRFTAKF
ncbi:MAG: carboxypeptidase-like regulatory domain-containing protein [Daejeonella sp.]